MWITKKQMMYSLYEYVRKHDMSKPKQWWSHLFFSFFFLFCCSSLCAVACLKCVLILLKCKHIIEQMPDPFVHVRECPRKPTWICVFAFATLNVLIWLCVCVRCIVIYLTLFFTSQRGVQHCFLRNCYTVQLPLINRSLIACLTFTWFPSVLSSNLCIYFLTVFISLRLLALLIFWSVFHPSWLIR